MRGPFKAAAVVAGSGLLADLAAAGPASLHRRQNEPSLTACALPETHGSIYETATEKFEILCGFDYPGGDYAVITAETFKACIQACESDQRCADVAYGFGTQACYLKDTVTTATENSGVHAARKLFNENAPISCHLPDVDGTIYNQDLQSPFEINCGIDFVAPDIAALPADSFAACMKACDENQACGSVSYVFRANMCYLKGYTDNLVEAEGVWGAEKLEFCESLPLTCENNASNGTIYTTSGSSFLILCGVDYGGGDMAAAPADTFNDCLDLCGETQGCIDVSYASGMCYLKSSLGTLNEAGWVWTGRKIIDGEEPTEPTVLTCADNAMDGKTFTSTSGREYSIICGKEYPGGDLQGVVAESFEACVNACDATEGCIDVSYVPGYCYMKSILSTLQDAAHVWTAVLLDPAAAPEPVAPLSCADGSINGTTFVSSAGREYVILCAVDYFGGDMGMVYLDTFEKCIEACDANEGCIDVAYAGQACYMKNQVSEQSPAAWVWNALLLSETPSTPTTPVPPETSAPLETTAAPTSTSPSEPPCEIVPDTIYLPGNFPSLDKFSPDRYVPETQITLRFATFTLHSLQMQLEMTRPTIVLEYIGGVKGVSCAAGTITIEFWDVASSMAALAQWDATPPIFVTFGTGCNGPFTRGFWDATQRVSLQGESQPLYTFSATQKSLEEVATAATYSYGKNDGQGGTTYTYTTTGAPAEPSVVLDCPAPSD
jgi:hypothetical protein